ncbi:MAG TPA: biotin/lipoyl-binding protein, partial [Phycisphaerales bacterium]|nr:biotin/lipoyl-binding protein [Phycisphaerales bacterium]
MKISRRIIYWVTAFVLVFVTFWSGYAHKSTKSSDEEKTVPVEVELVSTDSIEETMELTGWIKANAVVDVKSEVPGRIESLQTVLDDGDLAAVEEGLAVKKGQQLAVIDRAVYLAQLEAAKANVKAGEVELADAQREQKRIIGLYKAGSATEQSKDKAVTAAKLAEARLALAMAN